ncbi:hypothetical protein KI811_05935 [Geobacter hydrogenophilus]|uniref:Transporter n=1 Tax=Geobacter hydrogenophilus TaxID=40983 RepID=A0A9W6FZV7_9BACT|nr:hypothetical protein [Geobacter hydrogenophilus]MBT0893349.1 hypothetical protein [Geobacter hydrogenophilus]GLI37956.1 hypothetical protein GHYDROH2_14570 [Geobacter hydrogenophilus]
MKKTVVAVVGMLLSATAAHAEHKLLITDVLEQKQMEAQARFEYSHTRGDISSPIDGSGTRTTNTLESAYSLGVGLGHGLEMTASIPFVFNERAKTELSAVEAEFEKRDGFGDFALEAKYRLLGGEEEPFTLVTGLGLKFDTARKKDAGTGTTDVSPFIAASANLGHHYLPYASYRATIRNHDMQDTHTLSLGLEKELNHTVTLDAKIDANFNTSTSVMSANEDFVFEVSSYLQVAHNFYLIPSVAYTVATDATDKAAELHLGPADGFRGGLSLYYLF